MASLNLHAAAVAALAALSSACPGSESGNPTGPVANAGVDQTAWKGAVVSLDGRGSRDPEGDALSFEWRQTEGPDVALSDDRAAQPSFVAPRATSTLRFTLEVSDGKTRSAPDEVMVAIGNRVPQVDAGPDQVVAIGNVVTLDAAGSADPDGDPITATWFQRGGPPVTLVAQSARSATFTAPATPAVLEFGLVVSDGEAASAEDAVRVQVVDEASNWPPLANAGPDQDVARRSVVVLSGSALDRELDPLTWTWVQTSGPSVALLGADGRSPSFVAPVDEADLEFQLVVADPFSTGSDRVVVRVRNRAPSVWITLTPAAPVTTDPLVASASLADADQDPVSLTWQWVRNGTVLAGETGSTLGPALTTRGDVVLVRVTASDGLLATTAETGVTIQDAPPVLTLSAPATVAWGQPASFTISADDPDGDPVGGVVLLYGPAGMTVTPDGRGAWTPTLPMFDRALEVRFGVGVVGLPALSLNAAIRVEDPARAYPLRRSGIEIPAGNGLVAADLDGDGMAELLVAGRTGLYALGYAGSGYAQRWFYPFSAGSSVPSVVEARDVDRDGRPEIFFSTPSSYYATSGVLVRLDGVSRRETARVELACIDLEVGDLDGDGALDLVCLAQNGSSLQVSILDASTLAERWRTAALSLGGNIAIGNVDTDPAREIVTAGGYVFDGATGENQWAYGGGFGQAVDTGDLDGDGVEEIVGMDGWSRFRGFSAVLRSPLWEVATSDNDALLVADVDADGVPEVVIGDGQWGNVTAYRYRPATNDLAIVFQVNSQDHGVTALAVGDLDGDGALEVAWGSGASSSGEDVFVVAGPGPAMAVEWKNVNPSQLDGPFLGARPAVTVAGAPPGILFEVPRTDSGYAGTRLVRLDPATGGVAISAEVSSNWGSAGALDVADYDRDGVEEAFLSTADLYSPYLVAWDFAANAAEWTSPVDSAGSRALVHADLNGDGAPDLVGITGDGHVQAYDVAHGALLWRSTSIGTGVDVDVADVDGDGSPEIVALAAGRLVVFRKATSGPAAWIESGSAAVSGIDLEVADCDGDGRPELYVLGAASVMRFDGSLAPSGSFAFSGPVQSLYVEALGFARKNLVLAKGGTSWYSGEPGYLEAVDAATGASVWRSPPLLGTVSPNSLRYVDLGGDGFRAIAFGTSSGMYLTR